MADLRPEASPLSPTFSHRLCRERGKHTRSFWQTHSCITPAGFTLLITGRDTGEAEQAKSNINVGAVSVTLGLKGNESDGKEIFQIEEERENNALCLLKGKE